MNNRILPVLENKFININNEDIAAVVASLESKQLAGTAQIVQTYETALARRFQVKHALAVSSGTAALHLLMYLFDISAGDEVILPPTAPIMSVLPIIAVGAIPVFADVRHDSFCFDVGDVEKKITSRTKAILSVPMWGYPTAIEDVRHLANRKHISLIEDASHCHGSLVGGRLVGTQGDVGFFSTQERKLIATGEGGFIVTNNDDIADKVRETRDFGKPFRKTSDLKDHLGQYGFLLGLNFRLAAMSAALGITQLSRLDQKIAARAQNAAALKQALTALGWLSELRVLPGGVPNYYSMVLSVNHPRLTASDLAKHMYDRGVVSDTYRFGIKPLYELPILKRYTSSCPQAAQILRRIITVPVHEGLNQQDLDRIVHTLKQCEEESCN